MLTDEEIKALLIPIFMRQEQASIHWPDIFEEVRAIEAEVIERCAQVCDEMVLYTGFDCAAAIRALKKN